MGLDHAPRMPYFSFPLNNIPLYIRQHANLDAVKSSVTQKLSMKVVIFNLYIFINIFYSPSTDIFSLLPSLCWDYLPTSPVSCCSPHCGLHLITLLSLTTFYWSLPNSCVFLKTLQVSLVRQSCYICGLRFTVSNHSGSD